MCERALGWMVSCGVRFMVLSMVIGFLYAVAQRTIGDLGGRRHERRRSLPSAALQPVANRLHRHRQQVRRRNRWWCGVTFDRLGLVGQHCPSSASGMGAGTGADHIPRSQQRPAKGPRLPFLRGLPGQHLAGGKAEGEAGGAGTVGGRTSACRRSWWDIWHLHAQPSPFVLSPAEMRPPANDIVDAEWVSVTPASPQQLPSASALAHSPLELNTENVMVQTTRMATA